MLVLLWPHVRSRVLHVVGALSLIGATALAAAPARAQSEVPEAPRKDRVYESARAGMFMPWSMAPRTDTQRALLVSTGGYGSLQRNAVFQGTVDVTVYRRVALRAGVDYGERPGGAMRPSGGLRVQALTQDRHGIDMSVGAFYRPEGFTEGEGEIEGVVAFGRTIQRWLLLANLVYGQDPEGKERDGEVRMGSLYQATTHLQVGLDSRMRFDLGSEDVQREKEGGARYDLLLTPAAVYSLGWVCLIANAGLQGMGVGSFKTGFIALAGIGGSI
jgi:hypothetical protein